MPAPITVELFLDVSCPWCHGALGTMRRVLDDARADAGTPPIALAWRFMRLHDNLPPEGLDFAGYLASWMPAGGDRDAHLAAMRAEVVGFNESTATPIAFDRVDRLRNPLLAHRLLAMLRDDGLAEDGLWRAARAVFDAVWLHGAATDTVEGLRAGVLASGYAVPDGIWLRLGDPDDHLAETLADRERALAVQLDGVPRLLIGDVIVPAWIDPAEVAARTRAAIADVAASAV